MSLLFERNQKKFCACSDTSCNICLAGYNMSKILQSDIPLINDRPLATDCQKRFLSFVKYKYPKKFVKIINYLDNHAIRNMPCRGHHLNAIVDILNSNNIELDIE